MTSIEFLKITERVKVELPTNIASNRHHISYRVVNVKTREFLCVGDKLMDRVFGKDHAAGLIAEFDQQKPIRKPHTILEWDVLA